MIKPIIGFAASALIVSLSNAATAAGAVVGDGTPDCSGAAASLGVIWPPDHKMVAITVVGVTDPFDQALSITVTGIEQDEPVATPGSGHTAPDGAGIGTSTALVRAERAGPGTGRIYFISFSATNPNGQQCTGRISAFVPHDQGQGFIPTDTGLRFDSTQADF